MNVYEQIEALCKENDMNIANLEAKLGFSNGSIGKYKIKGSMPSADRLQKIAEYFNVTMDYLMTGEGPRKPTPQNVYPIDVQQIPVLSKINCDTSKYINEERKSYVKAGIEIQADFCLIASGDSMINARIKDGDIVFIRKQSIVENGDIAAVITSDEGEAALKRFYYYKDRATLILKAENPKYEDLIFQNEEINSVHVLGKAVAFQSDFE